MIIQKNHHKTLYLMLNIATSFILPSCSQEKAVNSQQKEEEGVDKADDSKDKIEVYTGEEAEEPIIISGEGVVEYIPDENVEVDPKFLEKLYNFTEKTSAILLNKNDKTKSTHQSTPT